MSDVFDCAKFFMKRGADTQRNTYDGNMKLQKLLLFADLICMAEHGKPLFDAPVRAFKNGCVVEDVRLRYKNDLPSLLDDVLTFEPQFSQSEYDALNLTLEIFGPLSAKELSELNHSFDFWKNAFNYSIQPNGYKNKDAAIVPVDKMQEESVKIKSVLFAHNSTRQSRSFRETINGIDFFYDPASIVINDALLDQLDQFSHFAEDTAYTIYEEDGNLVIY